MISNPIIRRELFGMLRRPQTLGIFVAMIALLALAVVALWPDSAVVALDGRTAQQVFGVFTYGLLVCLLMSVPAFPATAIVNERNSGTLALLLTSPLSGSQILVGKVSAVIGFVGALLALSLPGAVACFVMGGIDISQILAVYAVLALTAVQYAVIGLLVSSYVRSADAALRMTYMLVLLLSVMVLGPYKLLQGQLPALFNEPLTWLYCVSPIPAITQILGSRDLGSLGYVAQFNATFRYVVMSGLSIFLCTAWLAARLQPRLLDRSRATGKITDERSRGTQVFRRIMFLWFFDPQRRSGAIGDFTNPVMVKEFRTRALGRSHWMMRLIGACMIVSLALALAASTWAATQPDKLGYLGGVLVIFQMALVLLMTPALSAGLISSEIESRGWQLLQVTRLSPLRIIVGKLLSVAWTLAMLLAATIPGYVVLLVIDAGYADRVVNVLVCLVLSAVFALSLGAACSSIFRRTAVATAVAYLLIIAMSVGTLVFWLGQGVLFGEGLVAKVLTISPVAAALAAMRMPGFEQYPIVQSHWILIATLTVLCVLTLWARVRMLCRPD
ncbi:MAG: ABC transporter permease [Phycisphaeraceae bacterium]